MKENRNQTFMNANEINLWKETIAQPQSRVISSQILELHL